MKSLRIYGMLAVFILICLAVGGSGAAFPPGEWYRQLAKPPLNPPAWVFGPVWTLLYILMGVSAWLVWLRPGLPAARIPLLLFAAQMALNGAWSWIFFGWPPGGARPDRHRSPLGGDCGNPRLFLADQETCCCLTHPLSALGLFCHVPQCSPLAAQSLSGTKVHF